jgi:hypothetical protein
VAIRVPRSKPARRAGLLKGSMGKSTVLVKSRRSPVTLNLMPPSIAEVERITREEKLALADMIGKVRSDLQGIEGALRKLSEHPIWVHIAEAKQRR